jgi:outer membrane protein TolC
MRSAQLLSVPCLALLLAAGPAAAQPAGTGTTSLTFGEALARMRASHESLQAIDKERAQREEERKATRSLYLPKVDFSARFVRMDAPIEMDLSPIRDVVLMLHPQVPASRVPPFVETIQNESYWKANLFTTWPIFTGGKVQAANGAAEARVRDVEADRRIAEETLSTDLVRRYFGLRLAASAREVRADVLKGLDQHLRDATRLEEEGLISRAEKLHAAVAQADADRQFKRAVQDVEIARAGLANILSQPDAGDPSSPLIVRVPVESLETFEEVAQKNHPALAKFAAQRNLAGQALKADRGRWLPDVNLFGVRELHEADLTILDPKWAVGVAVNFTVFDGFGRGHRVAAAKLQQGKVGDLEQRARRDITTLVEKRYRELLKTAEQYDALGAALELGEENLRVRSRAFEEGLATSLDVVDARLSLSRVELERLAAAYDFDVALADLLEASGQGERFEQLLATGKPVVK